MELWNWDYVVGHLLLSLNYLWMNMFSLIYSFLSLKNFVIIYPLVGGFFCNDGLPFGVECVYLPSTWKFTR